MTKINNVLNFAQTCYCSLITVTKSLTLSLVKLKSCYLLVRPTTVVINSM
jgi:hypothetical protein